MPSLAIRLIGDPILATPARPVTDFGSGLKTLIAKMHSTLERVDGAALAAPQIGLSLRLFVLSAKLTADANGIDHIINPVLEFPDDEEETTMEGCLSISGLADGHRLVGTHLRTSRRVRTIATGVNLDNQPVTIDGTGFLARALQHENDHLDGILFLHRRPPTEIDALHQAFRSIDAELSRAQ
jgi:peptide deformylase